MDKITDELAAALRVLMKDWPNDSYPAGRTCVQIADALAAYDAAKAAQENPVEDHCDTMAVKTAPEKSLGELVREEINRTAPAKSHREILAEELDKVKLHHSAARVRGEKNDGHLMTMEGLEAALAAMARVAAPAQDHEELATRLLDELQKTDGDFDYPEHENRVWLEGYFNVEAAVAAALSAGQESSNG